MAKSPRTREFSMKQPLLISKNMEDFVHPSSQIHLQSLVTTRDKIRVRILQDLSEIQSESFFHLMGFKLFDFESIQNILSILCSRKY